MRPLARPLIVAALLGAVGLAGFAVAPPATAEPATGPAAAAGSTAAAWVRAGHLVPGFPAVTIGLTPFGGSDGGTPTPGKVPSAPRQDGALTISPAAEYGRLGSYRQVPAGVYSITVRPAGAAPTSAPVITGTLQATAGGATTIAVLGTPSSPQVKTLPDDLSPPPSGQARVRLINAAAGSRTVDVAAVDGPVLATGAAFASATRYGQVPGRAWTVQAKGQGRAPSLAASSRLPIQAGNVYTLLVLGSTGQPLRIQAVLDAAGMVSMPKDGADTGRSGNPAAPAPAVAPAPAPAPAPVAGDAVVTRDTGVATATADGPSSSVEPALLAGAVLVLIAGAGVVVVRRVRT